MGLGPRDALSSNLMRVWISVLSWQEREAAWRKGLPEEKPGAELGWGGQGWAPADPVVRDLLGMGGGVRPQTQRSGISAVTLGLQLRSSPGIHLTSSPSDSMYGKSVNTEALSFSSASWGGRQRLTPARGEQTPVCGAAFLQGPGVA